MYFTKIKWLKVSYNFHFPIYILEPPTAILQTCMVIMGKRILNKKWGIREKKMKWETENYKECCRKTCIREFKYPN